MINIEQIEYEIERIVASTNIPNFFATKPNIRAYEDYITNGLAMHLEQRIAKQTLSKRLKRQITVNVTETTVIKEPKTVWQYIKKKIFGPYPKLFKNHPVVYKELRVIKRERQIPIDLDLVVTADVFYPDIDVESSGRNYIHLQEVQLADDK